MSDQRLERQLQAMKGIKRLSNFFNKVTWQNVKDLDWAVGEMMLINTAKNTKVIDSENHMRFNTVIPYKGRFYPPHKHDFIEICTVIKGTLTDSLMSYDAVVGQTMIYPVGQLHLPENIHREDCIIVVDWVNTKTIEEAMQYLSDNDLIVN